jgi:hypothetical protein
LRLGRLDRTCGPRQLFRDIESDERGQGDADSHVGNEPVGDLENRKARAGRGDADVCAERNLESASENVSV